MSTDLVQDVLIQDVLIQDVADKLIALRTHYTEKEEALLQANLHKHLDRSNFEFRCEKAELMGFKSYTILELAVILMGEPANFEVVRTDVHPHQYEWYYNEVEDKLETKAQFAPREYYHNETIETVTVKKGWFRNKKIVKKTTQEKWRCRRGCVDNLRLPLPHGVVLKMLTLRETKTFNYFTAMAPASAWEQESLSDPLLIGTVYCNFTKGSRSRHYLIAKW